MKKLILAVLALAVLALAGNAWADLGSQIGGAIKDEVKGQATKAAKGAVASEVNKDLAQYTCNYDKKTNSVTGCNLKEFATKVTAERKAIEKSGQVAGSDTDYNLYIKTKNATLYNLIHDELAGKYKVTTWDIWQDAKGSGTSASFYVKVE